MDAPRPDGEDTLHGDPFTVCWEWGRLIRAEGLGLSLMFRVRAGHWSRRCMNGIDVSRRTKGHDAGRGAANAEWERMGGWGEHGKGGEEAERATV